METLVSWDGERNHHQRNVEDVRVEDASVLARKAAEVPQEQQVPKVAQASRASRVQKV